MSSELRSHLYILDENDEPVAVGYDDPRHSDMWHGEDGGISKRRIAWDDLGKHRVSTVFLGMDHGIGLGEPVLFETMIFGGKRDQEIWARYNSKAAALRGHAKCLEELKNEPRQDVHRTTHRAGQG